MKTLLDREANLTRRPEGRSALRTRLMPALLGGALLAVGAVRSAEPPPPEKPADPLPSGPGLAAAFPADRGIAGHPDVIFADDFENAPPWSGWQEIRNQGGRVLSVDDPRDPTSRLGRRCLKVTALLGENTGGGLTRWFEPTERVFIRFYVKFAPDCDYVHHFVTLRANRALTGRERWSGFGGAGEKPAGHERFSTALEPWGNWGRYPPPGRWHFYSYWHEMKPSPDGRYWGNSFTPENQPDIPRDRWICAEFMLRENTPGRNDGEQAFWIDGRLLGHWRGINWRKDPVLRANALTLESYVTDRWTRHRTNVVWFDNVVIARRYIGPSPPATADRR
ncbi:MAG: hypothetical protein D6766_04550 [Verrucomicrobia bacterium]|nr:MAG: hypothetical protein D6766_04550 [Verrucomicrobiota bacterium]